MWKATLAEKSGNWSSLAYHEHFLHTLRCEIEGQLVYSDDQCHKSNMDDNSRPCKHRYYELVRSFCKPLHSTCNRRAVRKKAQPRSVEAFKTSAEQRRRSSMNLDGSAICLDPACAQHRITISWRLLQSLMYHTDLCFLLRRLPPCHDSGLSLSFLSSPVFLPSIP
jgi:hypothetical protein